MAVTCTAENLAALTNCFSEKLSRVESSAIRVVLLCGLVNGNQMNCDPQSLSAAAKCFEMYSPQEHRAMRIVLLCAFLNSQKLDCTPQALADASKCVFEKLSSGDADSVETYLTCQVASAGGGGTCVNQFGDIPNPNGILTPAFVGQIYVQNGGESVWEAGSLLNNSWTKIASAATNATGSATNPNGSVTPAFVGQAFVSTTDGSIWQAGSLLNNSWVIISLGIIMKNADILGGNVSINQMPDTTYVLLAGIINTTGDLNFGSCPNLISFSAPDLLTIDGQFVIDNSPLLVNVNVPLLTGISNGISLSTSSGLINIDFPSLASTVGDFNFSNCTALTTITLPLWIPSDSYIYNFGFCNLDATSVNLILHRCALAGLSNATIFLDGGTNSAPTGQGLIDKAALIVAGNTVTTN